MPSFFKQKALKQKTYKRNVTSMLGLVTSALFLSACGASNSDNTVDNITAAPVVDVAPTVIRGVFNSDDELPSYSLPSSALPAWPLPTVEVDEVPSVNELRTLNVTLQASQQVGDTDLDVSTSLTAVAVMTLNETTGDINVTLSFDNIADSDAVTMVHIHSGFAGENGPVLAGLNPVSGKATMFSLNTNIDRLANKKGNTLEAFLDGGWYINLHTTSNPNGHLRGQIFTNDISVTRTRLQGDQQNPAIINADGVSGVGYVTVNMDEAEIVANVLVQGFVPFLDAPIGPVHLHHGFAGENGGVFLPLMAVEGSDTIFRATERDATDTINFERIAKGGAYINVHSAENSSGEIRGQVVPKGVSVARTVLEGQQQNPAIKNAEGVAGVGYVTVKPESKSIVAHVSVQGFMPFLDAPVGPVHLHSGFAGANGPVFLPVFAVGDSQTQFSSTELDAIETIDFNQIAKGGTYINVHSAKNGAGEIRGQVLMHNMAVVRSELQTKQAVPTVITPSSEAVSGVGYLTFNRMDASISPVANVTLSGFEASMVHVHRAGVAGETGPVHIGLSDISPADAPGTVFSANESDIFSLSGLLSGVYYFNAHSEANPAGEIRGQILTNDIRVFQTMLNSEKTLPSAHITQATAISFITVNLNTEMFNINVQARNFEPSPAFVSLNIAGDRNTVFAELADQSDGFFNGVGQVSHLQGLLTGGYSIQASEIAP